ncbi:MAG: pyridoxal phosphate-dependent aminotransferase [Pseudomonadota bacterium]
MGKYAQVVPTTDGITAYSNMADRRGALDLCSGAWTQGSPLSVLDTGDLGDRLNPTYPPELGLPELRESVADFYDHSAISSRNVMIAPGATGAMAMALSLIDSGRSEILIPYPSYPISAMAALERGHRIRGVEALLPDGAGWKHDVGRIEDAISSDTTAVIIVDPNNPTGSVLSEDDWNDLIDMAKRRKVKLIADRTYEAYGFNRQPVDAGTLLEAGVVVASSMSKSFHCASLRIGWLLAPASQMIKLATASICLFGGVPRITQKIAHSIIAGKRLAELDEERALAASCRDLLIQRVSRITTDFWAVEGGLFLNIPAYALGADTALSAWLTLAGHGLGGVPSSEFTFGHRIATPFIRLSFARPPQMLNAPQPHHSTPGVSHD